VGDFCLISYRVEQAGENFEAQILLVAQAVAPSLNDADLVVHALDKSQGDLILRLTVARDAVPVPVDHLGKFSEGVRRCHFSEARQFSKKR
jgi:hypothetical protein